MSTGKKLDVIGHARRRVDARAKVTGELRYADDLTFSTSKREFPSEIAKPSSDQPPEAHLWVPGDALQDVITRSGFTINPKKTRLMYRRSRQEVTGLIVNKKIGVRCRP